MRRLWTCTCPKGRSDENFEAGPAEATRRADQKLEASPATVTRRSGPSFEARPALTTDRPDQHLAGRPAVATRRSGQGPARGPAGATTKRSDWDFEANPAEATTERSDWDFVANPAAATREPHGPKVWSPIVGVVVVFPSLSCRLLVALRLAVVRRPGLLVPGRVARALVGRDHDVPLLGVVGHGGALRVGRERDGPVGLRGC